MGLVSQLSTFSWCLGVAQTHLWTWAQASLPLPTDHRELRMGPKMQTGTEGSVGEMVTVCLRPFFMCFTYAFRVRLCLPSPVSHFLLTMGGYCAYTTYHLDGSDDTQVTMGSPECMAVQAHE